jgi:hypothetical protein
MKAIQPDHDMWLKAARCMENEGGSFAGHIARAFYVADSHNAETLIRAFEGLFMKFYVEHLRNESMKEREASK